MAARSVRSKKGFRLSSLGSAEIGHQDHLITTYKKDEKNDTTDVNGSSQSPTASEHNTSSCLTVVTKCKHCTVTAGRSGQTTNLHHCRLCHGNFFSLERLMKHSLSHTYSGDRWEGSASLQGNDLVPIETDSDQKIIRRKYVWLSETEKFPLRATTKQRQFECGICARKFVTAGQLAQHMRIHTGERPYGCDLCGKTFIQKSGLDQHTRIHTGAKPYTCANCEKTFRQKSGLQQHVRTHTGEKPYQCEKCSKRFRQMSGLQGHKFNCS